MNPLNLLSAFTAYAGQIIDLVVHVAFAWAVFLDSRRLSSESPGRTTVFIGRRLWAVATLGGGVFVAGVYWVLHRSSIASQGK